MIRFGDYFPYLFSEFNKLLLPQVIQVMLVLAIPMVTFILLVLFWPLWVNYVRSKRIYGMKFAVFEIKLPKETLKSPRAMELFLHALHNTSDGNQLKQYWQGEFRPYYSLELASIEGQVKFYIWGEEGRKTGLMSALYAQFPGIEIKEVPDYTKGTFYDPKTMKVWAAEFELNKKEPFPIKTYIDYGLDKDPKEEFKVDPLAPGLEFLASVGANQQVWIQLIIRAHKKVSKPGGWFFETTDSWIDDAQKKINELMVRDGKTKIAGKKDEATGRITPPTLSDYEKNQVEAISRKITKLPFDVTARVLYIAKKESFDTPFGIGGLISFFKAFNTEDLNGFKPNGKKWTPWLDAPWKDFNDYRRDKYSKEGIQAFKMRSCFFPPFESSYMVLNTEELATMYHFPGSVAGTPALERVGSKKSEAPSNLPV